VATDGEHSPIKGAYMTLGLRGFANEGFRRRRNTVNTHLHPRNWNKDLRFEHDKKMVHDDINDDARTGVIVSTDLQDDRLIALTTFDSENNFDTLQLGTKAKVTSHTSQIIFSLFTFSPPNFTTGGTHFRPLFFVNFAVEFPCAVVGGG